MKNGRAPAVLQILFPLSMTVTAVGCAADHGTMVQRMGTPRTAREPACELTLVSPSDIYPGGQFFVDYEAVGMVVVAAPDGTGPASPEVKQQLRPEACALGGELIAHITTSDNHNKHGMKIAGQKMTFEVLAKKSSAAIVKY
jgi:hypothetical protein